MRHVKQALLILSMVILSVAGANAATSITIGKGDFYISIGDYDYLPYGYQDRLPRISFYDMMSDYGTWVSVSPFGRAWRPYVYYDWQPYTYGHWTYTRYGPTWTGYEPWGWVGYHYGNWIWSQQYGWVWLPGYNWHPGRVIWSYSYNTIGWMPAPPQGYNYFCGYLCPERYTYGGGYGGYNEPVYGRRTSDDYYNFEDYDDYDEYSEYEDYDEYDQYGEDNDRYGSNRYPGSSYDPFYSYGFRYDPFFYSQAYLRIAPRLWVFIPVNYFTYDNYSDVYFDTDFVRYLFDRRLIQINRQGLARAGLEQIVRQRVSEQQVQVKQLQTERQMVQVVVPVNEEEKIRTHANRVVKEVIAPAFVEKRKAFKGAKARNREVVARVFKQPTEAKEQAQVETLNDQTVLNEAKKAREERRMKRQQVRTRGIETIEKADREGKLEPMKRAREKAEKKEKAPKPASQNRPEEKVKKRTAPQEGAPKADSGAKFERWKKREVAKFNAWKEKQQKEFENWKELHKDNPQEVERAETEFQQKMRKAQEQFEKRTEQPRS
jgi:Family of unknown function (DUF6600)